MNANDKPYADAVAALNRLYVSRTGEAYAGVPSEGSGTEKITWLKRRAFEEQILRFVCDVLTGQMFKKHGEQLWTTTPELHLAQLAESIVKAVEICLYNPAAEKVRKKMFDLNDCSAYYDINTNERLPFGDEDLFAIIQGMKGRFVWDRNDNLSEKLKQQTHASIIGQAFDHEEDFWLRKEVKRGNDNLFLFGIVLLGGRRCLQIQRLRRNVVKAIIARKKSIPSASDHYSSFSRDDEVSKLIWTYYLGKEKLLKELADVKPHCIGNYQVSIRAARFSFALLLRDDSPDLKPKIKDEWLKILDNDENVLGDTQHVHNALYFNAVLVTKDRGLQKMGDYCGLKWVN